MNIVLIYFFFKNILYSGVIVIIVVIFLLVFSLSKFVEVNLENSFKVVLDEVW